MISMKQLQQEMKHVGKEDNQVGGSMEELQQEKKPVGKDVDQASGVSQRAINMATQDEDDIVQQETKHVGKEDNQVGGSMEELQQEKKPVGKDVIQASGVSQHAINMATQDEDDIERPERWLNRILSRVSIDQLQNRDLPTIPKVPKKLRNKRGFTSYYRPSVVSVGPYHYHKSNPNSKIGEMEAVKERAVILFFNLLNKAPRKTTNDQFINNFAQKMKEVREWYDKDSTTDIDEMDFEMMMFLDGCFIIMFIRCILHSNVKELGMTKHTAKLVEKDILMLENQLPFQVLKELCIENGFDTSALRRILSGYVGYCTRGFVLGIDSFFMSEFCPKPLHLLDLVRKTWIGKSRSNLNKRQNDFFNGGKETIFFIRGVKELTAGPTGISLRPSLFCRFSNIHFSYFLYGRLTLPHLIFSDLTKTIFINAIAQEACTENESGFSSYVKFLDLLIDNADDVKVMQSAGILKNIQGNEEELAKFINRIGAAVESECDDDYEDVKREMKNYFTSKWRAWLNEVIQDYLRSPWSIIAFLAGIFLLFLTAVQTYFAAFPHPGNGN